MKLLYKLSLLLFVIFFSIKISFGQENISNDTIQKFKVVSAGPQYKRSGWHNLFWGKNYRKEWSTPVKLPVFLLDSVMGGLTATELGGGHQTKSLHLKTKDGKDYTLRSVDKRLGKVLPEIVKGTFLEDIANDEVSMSNPYGAVTVPVMAQSAGIYHTTPEFFYLPRQQALDTFNLPLADNVYLFEQRLKGDWSNADNLGNFKNFFNTEDVIQKMEDESENRADQITFLKDRLFDMFIGDWDRHEDQWQWGETKKDSQHIFVPVPQDRDQAYSTHHGVLLNLLISASGLNYMQKFTGKIKNIIAWNFEERGLDRFFLNELNKNDWDSIAKNLQQSLADSVIEKAVQQFPPEIFAIRGNKIIKDLKSRRDKILDYGMKYYLFLTKEVEIVGTKGTDYFDVNRLNDSATSVNVYNITKEGIKENVPYYSRTFLANETKEIRLFGLSGNDVYTTEGDANNKIKIRIIGGYDKDSIITNTARTYVYDGQDDYVSHTEKIRRFISGDSAIHKYEYKDYVNDKNGIKQTFFYSDADRFYVGLGYDWQHFHWRKNPFVFKQDVSVHYSISQKAFSYTYSAIFPNTIGKWNLSLLANYDAIRWTNFYGLGNNSILTTKNKNYNRMRTREAIGIIGLNKKFGNSFFEINGFYQSVKIVNDNERYVSKNIAPFDPEIFSTKNFAGGAAKYTFSKLNDPIIPTFGITFGANVSYTQNVQLTSQSFWKYGGKLQLYVPLFSKFSLAIWNGIETVDGNPEFYQYPEIGGGQDLRGFIKQRFYGKTAFYNSNELRFISKVRTYIFNGKAGLLAFVDDGRVWMPGEESNTLHVGYGGGIVLAPFNKIFADITYGFSGEDHLLQFRFNFNL